MNEKCKWRFLTDGERVDFGDQFSKKANPEIDETDDWWECRSTIGDIVGQRESDNIKRFRRKLTLEKPQIVYLNKDRIIEFEL